MVNHQTFELTKKCNHFNQQHSSLTTNEPPYVSSHTLYSVMYVNSISKTASMTLNKRSQSCLIIHLNIINIIKMKLNTNVFLEIKPKLMVQKPFKL